jgi:hypothetical protein
MPRSYVELQIVIAVERQDPELRDRPTVNREKAVDADHRLLERAGPVDPGALDRRADIRTIAAASVIDEDEVGGGMDLPVHSDRLERRENLERLNGEVGIVPVLSARGHDDFLVGQAEVRDVVVEVSRGDRHLADRKASLAVG